MANTTYCDPPFFNVLRYLDISKSKTMILNAMLVTRKKWFANFYDFLPNSIIRRLSKKIMIWFSYHTVFRVVKCCDRKQHSQKWKSRAVMILLFIRLIFNSSRHVWIGFHISLSPCWYRYWPFASADVSLSAISAWYFYLCNEINSSAT